MKKLMCLVVLCLLAFFGYSTYQISGFVIGAMAGVILMIGSPADRSPYPTEGAKKTKKATSRRKGRAAA